MHLKNIVLLHFSKIEDNQLVKKRRIAVYEEKRRLIHIRNHFRAKIKGPEKTSNPLILLVIVSGFEPLAYRLGGGRSIQLSYTIIL